MRRPAARLLGEACCLISDSSSSAVLAPLCPIINLIMGQIFQTLKGLDCMQGQFSTCTLLLRSHADVIDVVCIYLLNCVVTSRMAHLLFRLEDAASVLSKRNSKLTTNYSTVCTHSLWPIFTSEKLSKMLLLYIITLLTCCQLPT